MNGWCGKILYINLTNETYYTVAITEEYKEFIGGRGANQYLMSKNTSADLKSTDPESSIYFSAGLFSGTIAPASSRLAVDFKSFVNDGIGSGNSGGKFASEMKYAGYDSIVVTGKSDKLTYVYIKDDEVYFKDASDFKELTTWDTVNKIKELEKENSIATLSIGIAGERMRPFACIIGDYGRAAAYGGGGAVFGSKNLKAIAIRGTGKVKVAYPDELFSVLEEYRIRTATNPSVSNLKKGGTIEVYTVGGEDRPHSTRNMSDDFWSNEKIKGMHRSNFEPYMDRLNSCQSCNAHCTGIFEIEGKKLMGVHANTMRAFGTNMDNTSVEGVLRMNYIVNAYGIDMDQCSSITAWAIQCYENGIIGYDDVGYELKWNDIDCVVKLVEDIIYSRGIGKILSKGIYEAAEILGPESKKLAMIVKKTAMSEASLRHHRTWVLGVCTSTKGSGHLRGAATQDAMGLSSEVTKKFFDIDNLEGVTSYKDKGKLVTWMENYKGVLDAIGACVIISMWGNVELYTPEFISRLYHLITGEERSIDELMYAGKRIATLERSFNLIHAGFTRENDMPPSKLVDWKISKGKFKGQHVDLDKYNEMLDEYYDYHDWDRENGLPTIRCIKDQRLDYLLPLIQTHIDDGIVKGENNYAKS